MSLTFRAHSARYWSCAARRRCMGFAGKVKVKCETPHQMRGDKGGWCGRTPPL